MAKAAPKILGMYDERPRVKVDCTGDKTRVQQHMRDEVDMNNILRKYREKGILTHIRDSARALYGDFSGVGSLSDAIGVVQRAETLFSQLPARIRSRFGNDPEKFIGYAMDEKNVPEMIELGLATASQQAQGSAGATTPTPSQPSATNASQTPPGAPNGKANS